MPLARLSICAFVLVGSVHALGCRSGVERDVVQRELRQQEDQIYALEDYLSEYQQLLCDARSENAALKRQIGKGRFRSGTPSITTDATDTLPSPPLNAPTPPPGTSPQEPDPASIEPEVPALDLSAPEVPPLDSSSENELEPIAARDVLPASAEIEVVDAPPTAVVLRGEVHIEQDHGDAGGAGPRVLLNVEPIDADGKIVGFHGHLSLLVLDPAAREKERQLARWDFDEQELAAMKADSPSHSGFEFPLQLPAESPTNRPLELWVRMLPDDGEKLLGRTTLDISRPGRFASAEKTPDVRPARKPRQLAQSAAAELSAAEEPLPTPHKFDANVRQSGWQTAKPGEVVQAQSTSRKSSTEWKTAARPMPEVNLIPIAESKSVNPQSHDAGRYRVAEAPSWAPDRPAAEQGKSAPPSPSWAPTR